MEIREPLVLTRLPRFHVENGRTLFGQVTSLRNGRKLKRQEISAAVDGDSVNVYEISNGRTVTSCPIPPDTCFTCVPCIVRTDILDGKSLRNLYFATKKHNELKLSMLSERVGESIKRSHPTQIILQNESPVTQIEVFPTSDTLQVLAIHEDAYIRVYNKDLSSEIRQGYLLGLSESAKLVYTEWLSPSQAAKTVFKVRPDLTITSGSESSFLVCVFQTVDDRSTPTKVQVDLGVWQIPVSTAKTTVNADLYPLVYHKFTITTPLLSQDQKPVILDHKGAKLILRSQTGTCIYTFTSVVPQKVRDISAVDVHQISSVPISDTLLLSSSPSSLQLFNTQFKTLQHRVDLNKTGLKRKRSNASTGHVSFIAYFPRMNRIVADRRNHIIAIDLHNRSNEQNSVTARQTSLLVNNIGKAALPYERPKLAIPAKEPSVGTIGSGKEQSGFWQKTTKQLEQNLQDQDFISFEKTFLQHIQKTEWSHVDQLPDIPEWKASFVMSKMFKYNDEIASGAGLGTTANLKLNIPAKILLEVLAIQGLLTTEKVSRALKHDPRSEAIQLSEGVISRILIDADPSLKLLHTVLVQAPFLTQEELSATVLILLRRALSQTTVASPQDDVKQSLVRIGSASDDSQGASYTAMVPRNLSECLCSAIERLSEAKRSSFPKYLRNVWEQRDIIALIQFLRQQLFQSGYTRSLQLQPYPESPTPAVDDEDDKKHVPAVAAGMTIPAIVSTLSDCIDAIGPIGVLSFGDEGEFVQTLIPQLSSEISKAVEAVQDALLLQGFVRETLRFTESTGANILSSQPETEDQAIRHRKTGTVVTIFSESAAGGAADGDTTILPLELRAKDRINQYKVRKGDGRVSKRSEREIGMLQDRLRGPYALERLVL